MNNPLDVSPSKGNQGTTRGKEKSFDLGGNRTHDLRIRSTVTLPTELRGRTEKVGEENVKKRKQKNKIKNKKIHTNVVLRSTMNTNGGFCPCVPVHKSRHKGPNNTQQLINDS